VNPLFYLNSQARDGIVSLAALADAVERFGLSWAEAEHLALENGLLPARYQRNQKMLSTAEQLRLAKSRVAVIGCGGLGGYVLEELARLGVGRLVAVDPDVFEEHNLNRQLLATPVLLGTAKVEAAVARLGEVNPAVTVLPAREAFSVANGASLLAGCALAVDALDSIPVRLELAAVCAGLEIPLVHGAIAGWYGQVTTQFPGDTTLVDSYARSGTGIEKELGNPSFTPALVASLEAAEVCKVLLSRGTPLRRRTLVIDLLEMEFVERLD
jgi:molybdopterin/thiamine biosynthesis adenylyltransferase